LLALKDSKLRIETFTNYLHIVFLCKAIVGVRDAKVDYLAPYIRKEGRKEGRKEMKRKSYIP
jgi:hypothetical protein